MGPTGDKGDSEAEEVAALLRGLRLGFIALISAVVTAAVIIGAGGRHSDSTNPYYAELTQISDG